MYEYSLLSTVLACIISNGCAEHHCGGWLVQSAAPLRDRLGLDIIISSLNLLRMHLSNTSVETNGTGGQAAKTQTSTWTTVLRTEGELEEPGTNGANASRCPMSWWALQAREIWFSRLIRRANHLSAAPSDRPSFCYSLVFNYSDSCFVSVTTVVPVLLV